MGARTTTEPTSGGAEQSHAYRGISGTARRYAPLWPLVLGLAFGRAGIITSSYGSYIQTDEGILTDGATLVALVFLGILLVVLAVSKKILSKRMVNNIMRCFIVAEALTLFAQATLNAWGIGSIGLRFGLSVVSSLTGAGVIYYWLRRTRGAGMKTAAVLVFAALPLSEIEIYLCALMPLVVANCFAGVLTLVQFPCMRWARSQQRPYSIPSQNQASDYFGFAKTMLSNKLFLIATAIGIGFLAFVLGLLRGYPDGAPIAFTLATRSAYGLLTIAISIGILTLVLKGRERIMTTGMFIIMECLACIALIMYAAFPDALDIGAVFATTLNAIMNAFTWYIIIAFMSFGWRDPYYYAIAGRLVFLGARACSRIFLMFFYQFIENDILMNALMGALIVVSTQIAFTQFLRIARIERDTALENQSAERDRIEQRRVLSKIMGLDEHESLADMRQASMKHNAEEMGKQFLLSDREIEVMALYALGYTQKRVAEELFITQGTAHAHIKRIYAKTGLHSRQEILDYLEQYAS